MDLFNIILFKSSWKTSKKNLKTSTTGIFMEKTIFLNIERELNLQEGIFPVIEEPQLLKNWGK